MNSWESFKKNTARIPGWRNPGLIFGRVPDQVLSILKEVPEELMKHFLSNLSNLSIILLRLFGGLTGKLFGLILDKYADEPFKESLEKSLEEILGRIPSA